MTDNHWTPERIDELRRYWSEGLSLSGIAKAMGNLNRNQVVGKAHRLNLPKRPSPLAAEGRIWYRNQQGVVGAIKIQPLPPGDDLGGAEVTFVAIEEKVPKRAPKSQPIAKLAELLKTVAPEIQVPDKPKARDLPLAPKPVARKVPEQNVEALFEGLVARTAGDTIHFEGAALAVDGLRGAVCRWPIGDPRDGAFRFCGQKSRIKSPYCDDHFKLAYAATSRPKPRAA